ncbi:hypothetical protein HO173_012225 [Letharia columbiana]|uniref:Uncharacterized protein n=1 Tax=Letharia columbiana TaxID=112416 RepID=A0A8H6CQ02_9LECA|nr:uncharacterized protein HO173_012225 [Letharia columbiana]KAF6227485.1 hypothetical protein HO173_012225 [Letharia columbiana]
MATCLCLIPEQKWQDLTNLTTPLDETKTMAFFLKTSKCRRQPLSAFMDNDPDTPTCMLSGYACCDNCAYAGGSVAAGEQSRVRPNGSFEVPVLRPPLPSNFGNPENGSLQRRFNPVFDVASRTGSGEQHQYGDDDTRMSDLQNEGRLPAEDTAFTRFGSDLETTDVDNGLYHLNPLTRKDEGSSKTPLREPAVDTSRSLPVLRSNLSYRDGNILRPGFGIGQIPRTAGDWYGDRSTPNPSMGFTPASHISPST